MSHPGRQGAKRRAPNLRYGAGLVLLLSFALPPLGADSASPDAASAAALVVTQVPRTAGPGQSPPAGGMLQAGCVEGARLVLVREGRRQRVLTAQFDSACDPDVAFDGTRVLFAGKKRPAEAWNIFEIELESGSVRQVTDGAGDCRHPIYQGTFYLLDSPEPWHKITFVSTRANESNEYGAFPSTSLYSTNADGSGVHRITFNPSSDADPAVLPDGRLLFSSWQRSTLQRGPLGRVGLFTSQTDGLDYAVFSADEGRRIKRMPAVTTDRLVVFVESDELTADGAGTLASVSLRRNLHSYRRITTEKDGLFHSPSALPGGEILVSRRSPDDPQYGVFRLDPGTGRTEPIFDDPEYQDIQAKLVAPRSQPDGRSSVVSAERETGALYCLNVYDSDLAEQGWIAPGEAKRLRVLEGLPRTPAGAGQPFPAVARPPLLQRRFLGEIPIEPDGSFNIEVPANLPIELQLVDADGMALRSCSWIWVRNRETRGCIGCHEDGERTPENRFVKALARSSTPLLLPPERRRTVDFQRDVMPIVSGKCASPSCHGGSRAAPMFDFATAVPSAVSSPHGSYVNPGLARTSPLVWHVFGRDTSRSWDPPSKGEAPPPMPPAGAGSLTEDERRTLVEWIDLGAQRTEPGPGGDR